MKKILWFPILLLLITCLAKAETNIDLMSISVSDPTSDMHKNIDNSYTFKNIQVLRGDIHYYFDSRYVSFNTVCKLLGFQSSLSGPEFNQSSSLTALAPTIEIDEFGVFKRVFNSNSIITKVTCYNIEDLKVRVDFTKFDNPDGSVKITNIHYHRGDNTFGIDGTFDYKANGICKMMGFEKALLGGDLFTSVSNIPSNSNSNFREHLIKLNDDGTFFALGLGDYKLTKITCFNGKQPDLIVLIDGNRYRYQQP